MQKIRKNILNTLILCLFCLTIGAGALFSLAQKKETVSETENQSMAVVDSWISNPDYYSTSFAGGSGSQGDPYLISNAAELAYLSKIFSDGTGYNNYSGNYFKQTADINLSAHYWYPIGASNAIDNSDNNYSNFVANYDGDGFSVSGIRSMFDPSSLDLENYSGSITDNCALFGCVGNMNSNRKQSGKIENVNIRDSEIVGYGGAAGIALYAYGSIVNCSNYATIKGYGEAAGILAHTELCESSDLTISRCSNYGDIKLIYHQKVGDNSYGAAGILYGSGFSKGSLDRCVNYGNIYSEGKVAAGIVGAAVAGPQIKNCYNTGNVVLNSRLVPNERDYFTAAGICAGYYPINSSGNFVGSVLSSYNTGKIESNFYAAGIVQSVAVEIKECFNVGEVICGNNYKKVGIYLVGPLFRSDPEGTAKVSNAYYGGSCANIGGIGGFPESEELTYVDNSTYIADLNVQAKTKQFYSNNLTNFDFESVWKFQDGENNGYPVLKTLDDMIADQMEFWFEKPEYYSTQFEGEGTEESPYLISSAQQLAGLSYLVLTQNAKYSDKYYLQTADINLAGKNFYPIGSYIVLSNTDNMLSFSGHYDGGGFNIYNLTQPQDAYDATNATNDYFTAYGLKLKKFLINDLGLNIEIGYLNLQMSGLFGAVAPSGIGSEEPQDPAMRPTIKNVNVINGNTKAYYAGGIAGMAGNADIDNCYYRGSLSAPLVGGICGVSDNTNITNCVAMGKRKIGTSYDSGRGGGISGGHSGKIQGCIALDEIVDSGVEIRSYGGIAATITGQIINCKSIVVGKNLSIADFGGIASEAEVNEKFQDIQILECLSEVQLINSEVATFGGIIADCDPYNWDTSSSGLVYINKCFFGGKLELTNKPRYFGAFIAYLRRDLSANASMIDGCAAIIKANNAAGESISFEKFYRPSTEGYKISCINSFSLFTDTSTGSEVKINTLTKKNDNMDGVFVCSYIYGGAPVIAGMYYDSDFGTSIGIVQCLQTQFNVTIEEDSSSETTT